MAGETLDESDISKNFDYSGPIYVLPPTKYNPDLLTCLIRGINQMLVPLKAL